MRAEGDGQDDDGHQDADQLAVATGRHVGVAETAVVLDLDARVADVLDGLLGRVELGGADLLDVEADRGERGLLVRADGGSARIVGTARGDHMGYVGEPLDGLLDGGLGGRVGQSVLGVEDHVRGVERLLREAVLDRVGSTLRLRAGKAEALVGLAAGRRVEREDRDGDEDPGADDAPRVATGEVADPVEEVGHGEPLGVWCAGLGSRCLGHASKVGISFVARHRAGRTPRGADRTVPRHSEVRETAPRSAQGRPRHRQQALTCEEQVRVCRSRGRRPHTVSAGTDGRLQSPEHVERPGRAVVSEEHAGCLARRRRPSRLPVLARRGDARRPGARAGHRGSHLLGATSGTVELHHHCRAAHGGAEGPVERDPGAAARPGGAAGPA